MADLIKTIAVLALWAAGVMLGKVFALYAPTAGYSELQISSILMVSGAWLSAISYLIIAARES